MLEKVIEFEIAEKLNPPQEKRAKRIPSKGLIEDAERIRREMEAKDVVFPEAIQEDIKALPIYEEDQSTEPNKGKTNE